MIATGEATDAFPCFGATCSVLVGGGGGADPRAAVAVAKSCLLAWHERFTRFDPASELSRLNADPRPTVAVSSLMARLAQAATMAGERTGGLVDATLLTALESAGYAADLPTSVPLAEALRAAPRRRPAGTSPDPGWRKLAVDVARGTVRRPPGLALDSGGLAKGLFADVLAARLAPHRSFAVDCAGDLRVGGAAGVAREVQVTSPFDGRVVHAFALRDAGVATSGIGRRSWLGADGRPAHHLLDPATGRPAFTGVVQATAVAPTALEAEIRAKAAVLSGPERGRQWLPGGGVLVLDDASLVVVEPPGAPAGTQR